jgi:hypothetical protein
MNCAATAIRRLQLWIAPSSREASLAYESGGKPPHSQMCSVFLQLCP